MTSASVRVSTAAPATGLLLLLIPSTVLLLFCCAGYTQLKPVSGQWDIQVSATKSADKSVFTPVTCNQTSITAACNQPPLTADNGDKLRVDLQLKDKTLKTFDNLDPKRVLVRACYTTASAVDRPWRKGNNVIDVSAGPAYLNLPSAVGPATAR